MAFKWWGKPIGAVAIKGTKPISFKRLFSEVKKEPKYFVSDYKKKPKYWIHPPSHSFGNRYRFHDKFLKAFSPQIKVFADVGCSFASGAPTTRNAKKALEKTARVIAIDTPETLLPRSAKERLSEEGIEIAWHSIADGPLTPLLGEQCDAIRLANVAQHMSQSHRRRAIVNIWHSLKPGGFLLGARVNGSGEIGEFFKDYQFVLRKTNRGFELLEF